ncbi:MAG: DsbA family protein [Devosia sp.]
MQRLTILLVAVVALLAGGLGSFLLRPAPTTLDESKVRAIFTEMLDASAASGPAAAPQSAAVFDANELNPMIESYLMGDPGILDRMTAKLTEARKVEQRRANAEIIQANFGAIYDDPDNVILGNPKGDVTLVEMFDYNCGYCRAALPDLATLIAEDPNLRVILKEFPILSQGSIEAARVAVLVNEDKNIDYWDFHQQLFSSRGQVTGDTALNIAEQMGMNRVNLMLNMSGNGPASTITKVYDLAKALNVSGTPTYILGDEVIPGAVGIDRLRNSISNIRACGSSVCPAMGTSG